MRNWMLQQTLFWRLKNTSAAKARKQFQRNGLCQHSRCCGDRSAEETVYGCLGAAAQSRDPASLAPGHARARAHQGSCLTDAVTSAVEVKLTPVYSPSWPEYLRLLLSGLVLSPGPDITDELAWSRGKSRERFHWAGELCMHQGVSGSTVGSGHSCYPRISVESLGLPSACPHASKSWNWKNVSGSACSFSPADGSDSYIWRSAHGYLHSKVEKKACDVQKNLEIRPWWR